MAGNITFTRNGATGSVVNEGQLGAGIGGYVALLAPQVRNSGVIVAHLGTVALASGESITLKFDDNHLAGITVKPSAIAALVENKGAVIAPGGLIILSAQAADHLLGGVVQNSGDWRQPAWPPRAAASCSRRATAPNSGTIDANAGAGSPAGSVTIGAPAIQNSGTISAAAPPAATSLPAAPIKALALAAGGHIALNANIIVQTPTGSLDVSGASGGSVALQATQDITLEGSISASAGAPASTAATDSDAAGERIGTAARSAGPPDWRQHHAHRGQQRDARQSPRRGGGKYRGRRESASRAARRRLDLRRRGAHRRLQGNTRVDASSAADGEVI